MWSWQGPVDKIYFPGFEVRFEGGKSILICKDNFGQQLWMWESRVKVQKKKPSEEKLVKLANAVYSEYIHSLEDSVSPAP